MSILSILTKKRQGLAHSPAEIAELVNGVMRGTIADYQLSAWLMAACIQGLNIDETTALTDAFVRSGSVLDWSGIDGIIVDKHSTGGVGDKTTLILVPLLAAAGLKVAKLSGRGLGFTGGTIDKLEAIPGFQTALDTTRFRQQLTDIGMALSSQTPDLAPADGRFYALRDVTATVESIPLIAASVVSKKIAAGAPVIVLDIKYGQGAFMKTLSEAQALATVCRHVAQNLGRKLSTVISDMNQPLGRAIGNALEVQEAIETLQGKGPADLTQLCLTLGTVALQQAQEIALQQAGKAVAQQVGEAQLSQLLQNGQALACFRRWIEAQGGDPRIVDEPGRLPQAEQQLVYTSPQGGYLCGMNALKMAEACKLLGAGRTQKTDPIDLSVGIRLHKSLSEQVAQGEPLATLYIGQKDPDKALSLLKDAFAFSDAHVQPHACVAEIQTG